MDDKTGVERPTTATAATCYDVLRPFSMSGRWDAVLMSLERFPAGLNRLVVGVPNALKM